MTQTAAPRTAVRGHSLRPPLGVVVPAVVVAVLSLLPLGFVVATTIQIGWDASIALLMRPRVGELLGNTLLLMAITVPLCVVIGVGAAWLVERTSLAGSPLWGVALAMPLAIPAFVTSYAWVSVIPSLSGISAGVLIATLSYFPFVYIPVKAALARLDPALEHVAASLGHGPVRVFFGTVLPQLRLALLGGSLLVALHLLSEYGAFAMIRFDTFTTVIMDQYRSTFNGPAGSMLAGVLMVLCLLILVVEAGARGRARYARIGSGVASAPTRARLGWRQLPAQTVLAAVAVLSLGVPLAVIAGWLFRGGAKAWDASEIGGVVAQTLGLGILGAIVTVLAAFPLAWLAVRYPGAISRILERTNYTTSAMPGIVLALSFVTISLALVPALYQTTAMLVIAYALLFLPRALVPLQAGIAQAPRCLEESAQALGRTPSGSFLSVTLRLVAPAAAAGGAMVFLAVAGELTATLLLSPIGVSTLATRFWSLSSEIDYAGAAPYALLLVLICAPMTYLLFRQSMKAADL
ncbi:ABC transporter permease [Microbacterium sp. ASV49]|uniref:Iron ABC transporter permease n=1 Tax=Microbacterium candidum TaxID=3041922 RepID=A0ABT7MWE8_9MICO|nr:iron ABC transporter permease [Microbacterium sp. ASV49]MDL9978768.1 iron ABC transporter permease [Microbacterium sp. ASV49]